MYFSSIHFLYHYLILRETIEKKIKTKIKEKRNFVCFSMWWKTRPNLIGPVDKFYVLNTLGSAKKKKTKKKNSLLKLIKLD